MTMKATAKIILPAVAAVLLLGILGTSGCGRSKTESENLEPLTVEDASPAAPIEPEESGAVALETDTPIAKVNGEEILFSDLQKQVERVVMSLPQMPPAEMLEQQMPSIMTRVLDNMISKRLLDDAVVSEGVSVADSDVVKQLRQIAARMPEGRKLSDMLAAQGSSLEEFQEKLKEDMVTRKLVESKFAELPEPGSEEVDAFYADNTDKFAVPEMASAHHILIGLQPEDNEEVKQSKLEEIEDIRAQIIAGADFEEMAREHSSGPSGRKGGDLGTFPRGQMLPAFDAAVFSQPISEVGEPIETRFGYHIVRVDERNPARTVPLEEASEDIKTFLTMQKREQRLGEYLQELRDAADIEILQDVSNIQAKFGQ